MSAVDTLLADYRGLVTVDQSAKRAMAAAERLFLRILDRTNIGEDRAYALAGVPFANSRSLATSCACREALERMRAVVALQAPAGVITVARVMVWATAMGARLSCTLSDEHAEIANSNRT